ncbi:MAG: DUF4298 domain-containing protein [Eubacteriales bacterium]|nr:DUF4298 domain-containing protein [Eubacteriales bacterium]
MQNFSKETSLARISEMEGRSDRLEQAFQQLAGGLEQVQAGLADFQALKDYYYSEAWQEDRDFSDRADFPSHLTCGVLSEDEIYNILAEAHTQAISMLEIALVLLK